MGDDSSEAELMARGSIDRLGALQKAVMEAVKGVGVGSHEGGASS